MTGFATRWMGAAHPVHPHASSPAINRLIHWHPGRGRMTFLNITPTTKEIESRRKRIERRTVSFTIPALGGLGFVGGRRWSSTADRDIGAR
jgi:hypothetical protein